MIHLKLYGLPRTATNALAYNIEATWPGLVRVWHDGSPSGETAWKHGEFVELPGIDGYLLCACPYHLWRVSMDRYAHGHIVADDRILRHWWTGWHQAARFFERIDADVMTVFPRMGRAQMETALYRVWDRYGLPRRPYHIETRRLNKNGDETPMDERLSDEVYVFADSHTDLQPTGDAAPAHG